MHHCRVIENSDPRETASTTEVEIVSAEPGREWPGAAPTRRLGVLHGRILHRDQASNAQLALQQQPRGGIERLLEDIRFRLMSVVELREPAIVDGDRCCHGLHRRVDRSHDRLGGTPRCPHPVCNGGSDHDDRRDTGDQRDPPGGLPPPSDVNSLDPRRTLQRLHLAPRVCPIREPKRKNTGAHPLPRDVYADRDFVRRYAGASRSGRAKPTRAEGNRRSGRSGESPRACQHRCT